MRFNLTDLFLSFPLRQYIIKKEGGRREDLYLSLKRMGKRGESSEPKDQELELLK